VLQIAFPTNEGAAIATASFPEPEAAAFEKELDATIDSAKGVAYRAPAPSDWSYLAWGLGAAVLSLAVVIAAKRMAKT
jgi:hypothetical protein